MKCSICNSEHEMCMRHVAERFVDVAVYRISQLTDDRIIVHDDVFSLALAAFPSLGNLELRDMVLQAIREYVSRETDPYHKPIKFYV